ncbi:MAG: hypothetical protein AAB263_17040 [Planctomycetota bacterium]
MSRILRLLLGLIGVAILLGLLLSTWIVENRIDKINFIVADYVGPRASNLNENGLVDYVRKSGCEVTIEVDKLIIRLVMGWTRKTWEVPRKPTQPSER